MENTFLFKKIRRSNRNGMILFGIFCILILAILGFSYHQFYNAFYGPFSLDEKALASISDVKNNKQQFVQVSGMGKRVLELENLAYTVQTRNSSHLETAHFIILQIGEYSLLTRVKDLTFFQNSTPLVLTGELKPFHHYQRKSDVSLGPNKSNSFDESWFVHLLQDNTFIKNPLLFELDTTESYRMNVLMMGGLLTVLFGFFVTWFILYARIYKNPKKHVFFQNLNQDQDPERIASQIDAELSSPHLTQMGPGTFTPSFFIWDVPLDFNVFILDQVVGILTPTKPKNIGKQRIALHFYLPTGKIVKIFISSRYGYSLSILNWFQKNTPWLFFPQPSTIKKRWKQEKEQVLAEAKERKNQYRIQ